MLTEGQRGRILFEFKLGDGAEVPELCGALMVHGQRVDMEAEDEGTLVIPVLPAGVYLAEVRAGGVCVLYGHVEVLPSPLRLAEGDAVFQMTVDCTTDVLRVSLALAAGIPGRRGAPGPQGAQGEPGLSAYELACLHGYAGSEAEWVAAFEGAQAAVSEARARAENAAEAARAADNARVAAETAKTDALAAQTKAQQEAAIATKAAADAQAPESIAAQSARPATMLLVKDELMSILGDARLFDLDTDGQKIIVHTDRLSDELLATVTDMLERFVPPFIEVVQYNHNMEVSWRDINKYAECTSKADMLAVNPDYINDLTSDGSWVYPLPGMVDVREPVFTGSPMKHFRGSLPNLKVAGEGYNGGLLQGLNLISFECELPVLEQEAYSFIDSRSMKEWNIELPMLRSAFQMFRWSSMTEWHIELPNLKKGHCMFGNSKMEDFKVGLPSLSDGSYFFESCQINKESALRVLNSIPAYTSGKHPLHIGIHVDHQADEEVLAAIDAATVKGWTVQVQWNGAATASTFALRPAPPLPVYAKVDTFTDEEGDEQRSLNWCHQVSSPDGKEPEELGYTLFESVAAAREYFGLPEDD